MKNKFEKFLMIMSSMFLLVIIVLGFKIENDNKKITQILDSLNTDPGNGNSVISQTREQILARAAQSPAQDMTQDVVTRTVTPGKIVKQTIPATSSSASSAPAKSTPAKKTKTS